MLKEKVPLLNCKTVLTYAGGFEGVRRHVRKLAVEAYHTKAAEVEAVAEGMMPEAQKFFLLTQTDMLWKEHLQVGLGFPGVPEGGGHGGL